MATDPAFGWPLRIYWEDTDAGGVVYHARYLAFMERARSEWLRSSGYGQQALYDDGQVFVVRAMHLDFLKPARLDDELRVTVQLHECRRASLVIKQRIMCASAVLVSATVHLAAVDAQTFRPQAIAPALRSVLQAQLPPVSDNPRTPG